MDIKQLHYFLHVAETGSFTKAAPVLGLTQPALSWQIGKLEAELGVELLSRNGRGVRLTDAGLVFLRRAKALVEDADRAKREMQDLAGNPMGIVTVGFPPAIGAMIARPLVDRVNKKCPDVQLQIVEAYSGYIHEWLLGGRIDIGIVYDATRTPSLACQPLANERLYLLQAADRGATDNPRVAFAKLQGIPLILPSRPHAIRRLLDQFSAQHQIQLNICMEVTAFAAIQDLVAGGYGATVLPVAPVIAGVNSGCIRAREIIKPTLSQVVGLAMSARHPALAAKTVAEIIRRIAAELIADGTWPERLRPSGQG